MNRRDFLAGVLAACGASQLACGGARSTVIRPARRAPAMGSPPRPPHHVVFVFLHGGYDSLLTFDPKLPHEVDGVDLEYGSGEVLQGRRRRYGPLFAPLLPHEERLAIVHGVRVDTAGHDEATRYVACGRVGPRAARAVGDAIGAALPGDAPIEHLVVGTQLPTYLVCGYNGFLCDDGTLGGQSTGTFVRGDLAREIGGGARDALTPAPDPGVLAAVRAERARDIEHVLGRPTDGATIGRKAAGLAELFEHGRRHPGLSSSDFGASLNAAVEAIRLGQARFITVLSKLFAIDSHIDNVHQQRTLLRPLLDDIAGFLDIMASTRNPHGALLDQTTVVIGTELGRFNRLNQFQGRDHWPENSWLLTGRGIRTAPGGLTIGQTDRQRRSLPIDFASGAIRDRGQPLRVESVFATIARSAGIDLASVGYHRDEVLGCLIADRNAAESS